MRIYCLFVIFQMFTLVLYNYKPQMGMVLIVRGWHRDRSLINIDLELGFIGELTKLLGAFKGFKQDICIFD